MPQKRKKQTAASKNGSTKNPTRQRLEGTPFNSATDYNAATERILREEWEQLERARARKELLQREEYQYILKRFELGLSCEFGNSNNKLFRVYVDKDGATQVALDEKMKSEENNEALIGVLIKSLSEAFEKNYLRTMKILPDNDLPDKIIETKN